ncbi:MAG TPA: DUF2490 domain-containing protein [Chitinophagaceae bacterium]
MKIRRMQAGAVLFCCLISLSVFAQKQVSHQSLFWLGSVNNIRFNERWGLVADFHYRTYDFMSKDYQYVARGLVNYNFNENLTAGVGYAHFWTGAFTSAPHDFSNEDRIAEQVQLNSKKGKFAISNRWRLEQRWQQKIVNNEKTNDYRFTDRARYAISFIYSPFKNKMLPSLTNYEEVMVQFGKEVVYNTFDQARFSFGIRQSITPGLNIDINYMYIYQQLFSTSGNQYLQANTLRLYINYNVGWRKK